MRHPIEVSEDRWTARAYVRQATTERPPPNKQLADDLRRRADRLQVIQEQLRKEENDLRYVADRIERGTEPCGA